MLRVTLKGVRTANIKENIRENQGADLQHTVLLFCLITEVAKVFELKKQLTW